MAQGKGTYELVIHSSDNRQTDAFESGDIAEHQASIADNRDANKAKRVQETKAVLGANSEYFTFTLTNRSGAAFTAQGAVGIDTVLVKNVPGWVQLGLYGAYSPFETGEYDIPPKQRKGIKPEKHFPTTLSVGSLGSSRQTNTTTATLADATAEDRLKLTPGTNEVLLIKEGAIITAEYTGFTI